MTNGDGLLLEHGVLSVVQNRLNQIAQIELSKDLLSGRVIGTLTDPDFDVPTTITRVKHALYAVNARFGTPPDAGDDVLGRTGRLARRTRVRDLSSSGGHVPPVVNVHTHYQPRRCSASSSPYGIEMTTRDGAWYFRSGDVEYSVPGRPSASGAHGLHAQIPFMDEHGIDVHVLQPSPMIFSYHLEAKVNQEFSRAFNDETARHIAEHPGRFWGAAQLPMQDPDMAAEELTRAVRELGLTAAPWAMRSGAGGRSPTPPTTPSCHRRGARRPDPPAPGRARPGPRPEAANGMWLRDHQADWAWGYLLTEPSPSSG